MPSAASLIRCFEWRDDETGELVGRALLRPPTGASKVKILKDRVGMCYEHLEGTKQSFFHKRIGLIPRLQTWSLMTVYGRWGSLRQKPSPLADALLDHQNRDRVRDESASTTPSCTCSTTRP